MVQGVWDVGFADANCRISADVFMATDKSALQKPCVSLNYILLAIFFSM